MYKDLHTYQDLIFKPDNNSTGLNNGLGIYANKVASTDIQQVSTLSEISDHKATRQRLYKTRKLISDLKLVSLRTCNCGKKPIGNHVEVNFNHEHKSANISGLETCGSVWSCPVCRNKILSSRAEDLQNIVEAAKKDGLKYFMLTLTAPHYINFSLEKVIGSGAGKTGFLGAIKMFRQHRQYRVIKNLIKYEADVRTVETTVGKNGWHFHAHILFFYRADIEQETIKDTIENQLKYLWEGVCFNAGMEKPSLENGLKITFPKRADYLAKWGAPSEISSDFKKASNGNKSIYELEQDLLNISECLKNNDCPEELKSSYLKTTKLLKEYYNTMFGKKLLTWGGSNFKKKYLKDEKTDEELATDEHGNGERLYVIKKDTFEKIYFVGVALMLNYIEKDIENGIFVFCRKHQIKTQGIKRSLKQCSDDDPEAYKDKTKPLQPNLKWAVR